MSDSTQQRSLEADLAVKAGVELVGTFIISFATYLIATIGTAIYGINLPFIILATGVIYAVVTYAASSITIGQFNPAITIATVLIGKVKLVNGVAYIIAQVLGAVLAGQLVRLLLPTTARITGKVWYTSAINGFDQGSVSTQSLQGTGISFNITAALAVEFVAGLVIIATALSALTARSSEKQAAYPFAIGLAYAFGAAITFPITGAGLNPARSTGIAIAAQNQGLTPQPLTQLWIFWVYPILAAALVSLVIIIAQNLKKSQQNVATEFAAVPSMDAVNPMSVDAAEVNTAAETNMNPEEGVATFDDGDAMNSGITSNLGTSMFVAESTEEADEALAQEAREEDDNAAGDAAANAEGEQASHTVA